MRTALITGAGGFVGRHLARRLAGNGWSVLCTDAVAPGEANWHACDISDARQVAELFAWAGRVTHVFHLAAVTFVPDSGKDPARTFAVNLSGTVHLVHAILNAPFNKLKGGTDPVRLIFIGSAECYGHPQTMPITEEHPLAPVNPYAISKAAADQYCGWAHAALGLDVVRMRPFNHSGPGQSDQFVLSAFARQLARIALGKDAPRVRVGSLDAARDFSHVEDVVAAYERAALEGVSGETYNVCSGRATPVRAALETLIALSGAQVEVETDPARLRPVDVPEAWGSHERLTQTTGWLPAKAFEELLADLLGYWRQQEEEA